MSVARKVPQAEASPTMQTPPKGGKPTRVATTTLPCVTVAMLTTATPPVAAWMPAA